MFNVLLTYFILGQRTSLAAVACCAVILAGFYLGVDQVQFQSVGVKVACLNFKDLLAVMSHYVIWATNLTRRMQLAHSAYRAQCMGS